MHEGQVRAILPRHADAANAAARPPLASSIRPPASEEPARNPAPPSPLPDPNALVSAAALQDVLAPLPAERQQALGRDYAHLWARTFRPLVRQLRGRPERALALFAEEVYPFLRGDRLAARVEQAEPGRAVLQLAGGIADAYLLGLVQGFVELTGAHATATAHAPGRIEVTYRIATADRLARLAETAATLRLNLVLAALLAAALGIVLATRQAPVALPRAAVVLGGIAAAQIGANALHAIRHAHPAGPLASVRGSGKALRVQLLGAALVALASALYLAVTGTPLVLLFAVAGLLIGLLYAPLRDRGLGPGVTLVLYGPLIAEGALHAFAVGVHHIDHIAVLPWTVVPGALAAAALYVDDLADAPLDEAGGKRTLAVRLPRNSQGLVYTGLLSLAFLPLLVLLLQARGGPSLLVTIPALVLALVALVLVVRVRTSLGNPRRLAIARLGTQALHALATLAVLAILGGLP